MTTRTYSELMDLDTFEERYEYLALRGSVGRPTFGTERWMNQQFYKSRQWRDLRDYIFVRDDGLDLGADGYGIAKDVHIHHMNPMAVDDLQNFNPKVLEPEYLISVSLQTHNAIHYATEGYLPRSFVERYPGDTDLW